MGILYKTKAYLIGAMDQNHEQGMAWRKYIQQELADRGIIFFDPYCKPFVHTFEEDAHHRDEYFKMRQEGRYDELSKIFHEVRCYDLNCVDRSDFLIFYYDVKFPTVGSWEEGFWGNRLKKPIFFICEGGKNKCPLWVFGTIPHKYIYNNLDEAIAMIKRIDDGTKVIDSDRWRLLKESYR